MWILYVILFIHYLLCSLVLFLKMTSKIDIDHIVIIIAYLIPVIGLVMLLLKWNSDRNSDREREEIDVERVSVDDEKRAVTISDGKQEVVPLVEAIAVNDNSTKRELFIDALYDINRSIVMDDDELTDKLVPIEEALVVNDTATRRALIIDVLYSNPDNFVSQLFDAKANGDTEVVHYAATALTEIQKEFDLRFKDVLTRRKENPDDEAVTAEYLQLLEQYISSGLLDGDGLKNQLSKYSDLLGKELSRENIKGRWTLINKKANADLKLGDIAALDEDVKYMMNRWPDREGTYMFRLQSAVIKENRALIDEVIKDIRDNNIYLSSELKSLVKFWDGDLNYKDGKPA